MRIALRPTVAGDLASVTDQPLPHRIKALTAVDERGNVLGIGGLGFRGGVTVAFVAMRPEARKYPAAIHRAGLAAMTMIRKSRHARVIAEAEPDNPAAERWLERLGFRAEEFAGVRAFVWERTRNDPNDR